MMDLRPLVDAKESIRAHFGSGGQELTLLTGTPDEDRNLYSGRIVRIGPSSTEQVEVSQCLPLDGARLFRNGNYLLFSETPRREMRFPGANAFIYSPEGELLHEFCVGDYIAHLQCDADDRTWVSYIDQGAGQALAEDGLACFGPQGQPSQFFQSPGWILDCYAMNVAKDAVWLCYYTDFPIVRIGYDGRVRSWTNSVRPHAIAARGYRVALFSSYATGGSELRILEFQARGSTQMLSKTVLEEPGTGGVWGRGMHFHTIRDGIWYRLSPFSRAHARP